MLMRAPPLAQVNDGPCVTYVGPGGAGNFVKMVHNGIEYGDMQLISEAYDVLKTVGGLSNEELVEAFNEWNAVRMRMRAAAACKHLPCLADAALPGSHVWPACCAQGCLPTFCFWSPCSVVKQTGLPAAKGQAHCLGCPLPH